MIRWLRNNATRMGIVITLLVVGGILALIDQRDEIIQPGPVPTAPEGEPDYVLQKVEYTHFDTQGVPYQTLTSPRIVHLPGAKVSTADQPVIGLIDDDKRHWQLTGHKAVLSEDDSHIRLAGAARVVAPEQQWRLETDTLEYQRESDRVWSNSDSRFFQGQQTMRADRFEARLNAGTMALTGNVVGEFPPDP